MEYKHKYTRLAYTYITYAVAIICGLSMLSSCTSDNDDSPIQPGYDGVPLVILDTDIGSSADDLFAMEMLYHYMDEGRCKLLGIVVNRMGDDYAALADVMNTYFGHGSIPIGVERGGVKNPKVFIDYRNLYKHTTETGELMFKRTLSDYSQLPNGWELYRRDISPLSGVELVRQKVKCLYLMAGVFTSSEEPDYNFRQDPTYAKLLFEFWPRSVDVVFSPMEVGNEIDYSPETVISDISWTDIHPIKQVYMKYDCNTGQKMWDEGEALFTLSERGIVTLTPEVGTIFTSSATGNDRYQKPGSKAWCDEMLKKIRKSLLQSRRE